MADHTQLSHLRLVTDAQPVVTNSANARVRLETLLERAPNLLCLFRLAPLGLLRFAKVIDSIRPRYIFDLRVFPLLEGTAPSRHSFFRLMESTGCSYVDTMGRIGGRDQVSTVLQSAAFQDCVQSVCGDDFVGPMFFLFESGEDLLWSRSTLLEILQPAPHGGWNVQVRAALTAHAADTVQPWAVGEVLYVVASPNEPPGRLLDDRGRPTDPVSLPRGSSVRVIAVEIGLWTDVAVLGGPYRGQRVRLASNAQVARLVK